MNPSTEKMLKEEIPRIRELLEAMQTTQYPNERPLSAGVTLTKNGRFMKAGKFISKQEAYE